MCLILFAINKHPEFPLIVAANRDEFFSRPTLAADFWKDQPHILAGRDLTAGGTWLGVNTNGQFTAVTNFRDGAKAQDKPGSRGQLTRQFLLDEPPVDEYFAQLQATDNHYNGYNLLAGNAQQLGFRNNHSGETYHRLEPGIYGLSNASLNSDWPKVNSGRQELGEILEASWKPLEDRVEDLFTLLADDRIAPDDQLPNTGIDKARESLLSSRFINVPDYGTRASTIVLYHHDGDIHFIERGFDHRKQIGEQRFLLSTPT